LIKTSFKEVLEPAKRLNFDRAGNVVAWGEMKFVYSAAGRPIQLYVRGELAAAYLYNAQGERVAKTLYESGKSRTIYYLYDEKRQLEAEANESGQVVAQYVYLNNMPIAVIRSGELYYVHHDATAVPQAVTDKSGRLVWAARYRVFGLAQVAVNPDGNGAAFEFNLRLPGQYFDAESSTHYNYFRTYDPYLGRYLQPDPLGAEHGMNLYAYVDNNPVQFNDPLGLFKVGTLVTPGLHEQIIRDAFAQFNSQVPNAFSAEFVELFVNANVNTDLNSSNQFDPRNHFDNPNDGPPTTYTNTDWIQQSLDLINDRRWLYTSYGDTRVPVRNAHGNITGYTCKKNVSILVAAFGMNTHTLADFYAHTNWVDPSDRGGSYIQEEARQIGVDTWGDPIYDRITVEQGTVPTGLGMNTVWDEQIVPGMFSGNAEGCASLTCAAWGYLNQGTVYGHNVFDGTDRFQTQLVDGGSFNVDMTTHAYWAKDSPSEGSGMITPTGWTETLYDRARRLAVEHTLREIQRLYDGADADLRALFQLTGADFTNQVYSTDINLTPYLP